ncbi:unnamed protein product [Mesocestoides corti]|uniref:Sushi domain-containing protein n=1 Tax=Mesocestoides corti TaxID=53468 RepID=A0A3P6HV24_MESCO|nr:unnamed protein product [Mesocestoides corti]
MRYQGTAVQFCNDGYRILCPDETGTTESSTLKSMTFIINNASSSKVGQAPNGCCRRVCQADGTWSGKTAECIPVTCPKLQQPENGFISSYLTKVNSIVAFECAEGFELRGSSFRKCQPTGEWDGEPASCQETNYKPGAFFQFLARCTTRPPNIPNALTRFYSLQHGSVVRYQCFPGYRLNTSYSDVALRLTANASELKNTWPLNQDRLSVKCEYGVWKGELPSCIQVRCSRPPVPTGIEIYLIGARGRWPFDNNQILPSHGAAVEFSCVSEDHRIQGPRYTFCIEGHWSPAETPNCTKVTHDVIPQSWLFYKP